MLYIGKLQNFTPPMVRRYFEKFGGIENVHKPSPQVNFAIITFVDADSVDRVMQSTPHFVDHDVTSLSQEVSCS